MCLIHTADRSSFLDVDHALRTTNLYKLVNIKLCYMAKDCKINRFQLHVSLWILFSKIIRLVTDH